MKRVKTLFALSCLGVAAALIAAALPANRSASAQSGSSVRQAPATFESKFWIYLQSVHYENWAPAVGQGRRG